MSANQAASEGGSGSKDERSREDIMAEREAAKEAKRKAKAAKAAKAKDKDRADPPAVAASGSGSSGPSNGNASLSQGSSGSAGLTNTPASLSQNSSGQAAGASAAQNARGGRIAGSSGRAAASGSRPSTADSRPMTSTLSTTTKAPHANAASVAKPSVLGGIALFGNVQVAKTDAEMRQHIVSASLKSVIHPSVLSVAQHLASYAIVGADARAIAVLKALRDFVLDYKTPTGAVLHRDLVTRLGPQIGFLVNARPLGASVGHAIRYLKYEISVTPVDMDDGEAKEHIISRIDYFIRDRITYATRVIADNLASSKLNDGATILTFGKSSVVQQTLIEAWQRGTRFNVIIVDARPLCEGRKLLASLQTFGIPCTYGLLTSLSMLVSRASIVLLGTACLMANGALYARAGTAPCAMMAKAKGVPVIVCCETYKFSERVQLDGFVVNEAGDPTAILCNGRGNGDIADDEEEEEADEPTANKTISRNEWEKYDSLGAVNLLYDLTPPRYITAVASEVGLSGPESVGVILRDYKSVLYGQ